MIIYKALTKAQIAKDAGVSIGIVRSWCKTKEAEMLPFGYTRKSQQLNPQCVRILAEFYNFTPHNCEII